MLTDNRLVQRLQLRQIQEGMRYPALDPCGGLIGVIKEAPMAAHHECLLAADLFPSAHCVEMQISELRPRDECAPIGLRTGRGLPT